MYAKYGKIHKAREYEHNCVMMYLKNNAMRVTYAIKVLQACFFQLTTFELVFDTLLKYSV